MHQQQGRRADGKQQHPTQQGHAAPIAVYQRAIEKLPERQSEKERREAQLHLPHAAAQTVPNTRKTGQIHIRGKQRERRQCRKNQNELARSPAPNDCFTAASQTTCPKFYL